MNKKGFIFLETISIIMVVSLALCALLATYTLVYTKSQMHKFYDQPRDLYMLYSIANMIDTSSLDNSIVKVSNANSCEKVNGSYTILSATINNCEDFMNEANMTTFAVIDNLNEELKKKSNETYFDNVTIEYLKTLSRCVDQKCENGRKYLLGVFRRQGKYYYASIEL